MSVSSSDKEKTDSLSQDAEDSGHDSIDDTQSALDDRERINHLETAVAWIREEVNNLKEYDTDILKELRKIRLTVHEIQDTQKEVKKEQKYLDLLSIDRSPTPNSLRELPPSPTPSPEPFVASDGHRYRTGTLELLTTAPTHLKQKNDDKILEEFFGSNDFKLTVSNEEGANSSLTDQILGEVQLREKEKKLKIPLNPNPGPVDRNRMSYDVASEMEQLRARIQEKARMELEDLDKKYSPKFSHPGFGLLESSSHSRQGSLDSSMPNNTSHSSNKQPGSGQTRHSRQASLPVFFDPNSVQNIRKSPTPQLKTQIETRQNVESDSRSPTPPLTYLHIRQTSAGSASSVGSGTVSPPLTVTTAHVTSQQGHKPYSTPPLIRSPQRNIPQFQSLRERSVRPHSATTIYHAHSNSQPTPLPSQFIPNSKQGTGYSTAPIKGPRRYSPEGGKQNGYTAAKPPLPANHGLYMTRNGDLDQPEVKSVSRVTQLRRAPSGEKVAASLRMGREMPLNHGASYTSSGLPGPINSHQRLTTRLSEPGSMGSFQGQANQSRIQVHPEDIQPYTTSREVRGQVFKYTPYMDNMVREKSKSLGPNQNRQNPSLLPKEQTWC